MTSHFKNAVWGATVTGIRALFALANPIFAVKLLGVAPYGYLMTILSIFVIYVSLASALFSVIVVRLCPLTIEQRRRDSGQLYVGALFMIAVLTAFLFFVVGIAFLVLSDAQGARTFATHIPLILMSVLATLQIFTSLQNAVVEAEGRFDLVMKSQLIGAAFLPISFGLLLLLKLTLEPITYLLLVCASAAVDLVVIWCVRRIGLKLTIWQPLVKFRLSSVLELLRSATMLQATSLMNLFLDPFNRIVLGYFMGPTSVTIYDLGMKVIWGIQSLFTSAMRVFLHISTTGDANIREYYTRAIQLITVPSLVLHTFGFGFLYWLANYWLVLDGSQIILFFALVSISNLGMIFITPIYSRLVSKGELAFIFKSQLVLAGTNLIASLITIPFFGIYGAAFGLLIALTYNIPMTYLYYQRKFSKLDRIINIFLPIVGRILPALAIMILTAWLSFSKNLGLYWLIALTCIVCLILTQETLIRRAYSFILNSRR
jgi:O-antigen/teichoic acid export membrane protein